MSTSTNRLRLGPLPSTETVKLTFTCPIVLKTKLERYAAAYKQIYGEEQVDAAALIPHMLEAFMARDRGFQKAGAPKETE
jgi:hypothetical protein